MGKPSFGEEYYLEKSRKAASLYEAKSFIRMGTLQFPDSFRIEFEGYRLSKQHDNPEQAAKSMDVLAKKFSSHKDLSLEIKRMLEAVKGRFLSSDAEFGYFGASEGEPATTEFVDRTEEAFLCRVFDALKGDVQRDVIEAEWAVVGSAPDSAVPDAALVHKCCLLFILLRRFPESAGTRGMALFRLVGAVSTNQPAFVPPSVQRALHVFRRTLVGEVLPLIVPLKEAFPSWDSLADVLRTSIDFSLPLICEEIAVHRAARPSAYFEESKDLASGEDGKTTWQKLVAILHILVKRLERGLKMSSWFAAGSSVEAVLAKLESILVDPKSAERFQGALGQQIASCLAVLIVRCMLEYGATLCPLSNAATTGKSRGVLVDGFPSASSWPNLLLELGEVSRVPPSSSSSAAASGSRVGVRKLSDDVFLSVSPLIEGVDSSSLVSGFVNLRTAFSLVRGNGAVAQAFDKIWTNISWAAVAPLYLSVMADLWMADEKFEEALALLKARHGVWKPRGPVVGPGPGPGSGPSGHHQVTQLSESVRPSGFSFADGPAFSQPEDLVSISMRVASCLHSFGRSPEAVAEAIDAFVVFWRQTRERDDSPTRFYGSSTSSSTSLAKDSVTVETLCPLTSDSVASPPPSGDAGGGGGNATPSTSGNPRVLVFLSTQVADVAKFAARLVINALKPKAFKGNMSLDDAAFGHMMVLMQLDWPLDEDLFMDGCKRIQAKGSFAYPLFAKYVVEKYFLDVFSSMASDVADAEVKLEIFPNLDAGSSTKKSGGLSDPWREAFVRLIQSTNSNRLELIARFIGDQRNSLVSLCGPRTQEQWDVRNLRD